MIYVNLDEFVTQMEANPNLCKNDKLIIDQLLDKCDKMDSSDLVPKAKIAELIEYLRNYDDGFPGSVSRARVLLRVIGMLNDIQNNIV